MIAILMTLMAISGQPRFPRGVSVPLSRLLPLGDTEHIDLPCPWCRSATSEDDTACPGCGQQFG